jgi:hypothetical protein
VGAKPTRQSLQPEAIGAVMEVTKWLKPSISVSRIGDSASVANALTLHLSGQLGATRFNRMLGQFRLVVIGRRRIPRSQAGLEGFRF